MRCLRVAVSSVLLSLWATGAWGADGPLVRVLPDLPSAQVAIPWPELKSLLEERVPPEQAKEEPPPVPWTIAQADYHVATSGADAARIDAAFDIYVWKSNGWAELPLLAPAVAVTEVLLDGEPAPLVQVEGGMRGLLLKQSGPHRVTATFFVPLAEAEGVVTMEFPSAPASINLVHLDVPVPDAVIMAEAAAKVETKRTSSGVASDLAFRSAEAIAITWRLPAKLTMPNAAEPVRVVCTASTLAAVTERVLSCDTLLVFSVLRGTADTFAFTLPAKVNVLQVDGQGAAWTRSDDGDSQRIEVKVNHFVNDQYTLSMRYEAPMDTNGGVVTVPELDIDGVARQTGWIGIVARDNVEVSPDPANQGYTRVDITELPVSLLQLSANPILLAYRANDGGGMLAVEVRKLADVPVRPATIAGAQYTTLLTEEGARMTRAVYEVRNNVRQYLRVDIGADSKVTSAAVGGRLIKPARDGDDGAILLPLLQSTAAGRELGAFPVELLYTEDDIGDKPADQVDLALPAVDLPIERVRWEIWIPNSSRVVRAVGDLTAADNDDFKEASAVARARRTPRGTKEVTVFRLRDGIERFFITDINNPVSTKGVPGKRYNGTPIQEPEYPGAAVAGILPVAVDMPLEGTPYAFSRTLVNENRALHLALNLYSHKTGRLLQRLGLFTSGLFGAMVFWLLTFRRRNAAYSTLASGALLGAYVIYAWRFGLVMSAPLAVAACVGAVLFGCIAAMRRRWRRGVRAERIAAGE